MTVLVSCWVLLQHFGTSECVHIPVLTDCAHYTTTKLHFYIHDFLNTNSNTQKTKERLNTGASLGTWYLLQ